MEGKSRRGILKEEFQKWNPGGGIRKRNPQEGWLEEESQSRNPGGRTLAEGLQKGLCLGGTSRGPLQPPRISLGSPGPLSGLRGKVC